MSLINHESTILPPRDAALIDSDAWPIFSIKNAVVFDPDDAEKTPLNLLHAGAYRPLAISGKLDSPPPQLVLKPSYQRTQPIDITNVTQFSYGQYEDGSVDIWAAGDAGWYTIHPSRVYKDIYAHMVQAVKLLYFIVDEYTRVKRPSDMHVPTLMDNYRLANPDTCPTIQQVEQLFAQHRYFLFVSMLDGKEGLQWSRTSIFKYFDTTFPDDAAIIRQRRAFSMRPPSRAPSNKRNNTSPAPSNASLKRKRKAQGVGSQSASVRSKSPSASLATTSTSVSVTNPSAPAMDPSASQQSASQLRSQRASRRSSSQIHATPVPVEGTVISDADSDDESAGATRSYKGKTKSTLRPKPVKYIDSQKRHFNRAGDGNEADDDETEADVKGPVQESPASKRKMLDDLRSRRAKRRNSHMQSVSEDADHVMTTDSDGHVVASPTQDCKGAKETLGERRDGPLLHFRFRDAGAGEDDGDVWQCETDGCMHKVYAASEETSRLLISDHRRLHDHDDDQRVQLVRSMQAPWLPVDRLMGRVRQLAAQNGTPAPMVRRY